MNINFWPLKIHFCRVYFDQREICFCRGMGWIESAFFPRYLCLNGIALWEILIVHGFFQIYMLPNNGTYFSQAFILAVKNLFFFCDGES